MLSGFLLTYQNKLEVEGIHDIVNIIKIKFEPDSGLVDEAYFQFNDNFINNEDSYK